MKYKVQSAKFNVVDLFPPKSSADKYQAKQQQKMFYREKK